MATLNNKIVEKTKKRPLWKKILIGGTFTLATIYGMNAVYNTYMANEISNQIKREYPLLKIDDKEGLVRIKNSNGKALKESPEAFEDYIYLKNKQEDYQNKILNPFNNK